MEKFNIKQSEYLSPKFITPPASSGTSPRSPHRLAPPLAGAFSKLLEI
jgi:hypothetical protein